MKKFPGFPKEKQSWDFPTIVNGYVHKLTGGEFKVLWYILRHTFGWQKTADAISYKQFREGIKKKDGTWLDKGTGLNTQAIRNALKSLEQRGFIISEKTRYKGRQGITIYSPRFGKSQSDSGENQNQTEYENQKETIPINKTILIKTNNIHEHKVRVYKRLPLEKQTIVHRLCYYLEDLLNTKIVNWGKQGKAIKQMIRAGYTENQIKKTIEYMAKKDDFFTDKGFDLTTVSNQISRYKAMSHRNNG